MRVASRVRQETFITYEPLLLLALVYMCITGIIVLLFRKLEARIPGEVGIEHGRRRSASATAD